jgi:hypothetical protein
VDSSYELEVQWTAQIVKLGVWKQKYYGASNTSMVFQYSRASTSYSLVWWENLWKYTKTCATYNCDSSSRAFYSTVRDFVTKMSSSDTSVSSDFSYGKRAVNFFENVLVHH